MKKLIPLLTACLLIFSCKQKQQEVQPQQKILTEAVYASGTLVPEVEYKVTASTDGYLNRLFVNEGDTVRAGQLLFGLQNEMKDAREQAAAALVRQTMPATTNDAPVFAELLQRLDVVKLKLQNDSLEYHRYRNLFEQNAISKSALEKRQLQYETTVKEAVVLQQQIRNQRVHANIQLQQASNQLVVTKAETATLNLKSYANGVVFELYKQKGDLVTPGQPIALIGRGKMIAKLLVDEDDLAKIRTGQKVLINLDAYQDKVFNGTIHRIYPVLSKAEQSFRVDALLIDPIPDAIYGLNVEANIVLNEERKVTVIPKKALLKGDSVLVKYNNQVAKIKIKKGIEDDEWLEIKTQLPHKSLLIIR